MEGVFAVGVSGALAADIVTERLAPVTASTGSPDQAPHSPHRSVVVRKGSTAWTNAFGLSSTRWW
jgi:hypothetical protein